MIPHREEDLTRQRDIMKRKRKMKSSVVARLFVKEGISL